MNAAESKKMSSVQKKRNIIKIRKQIGVLEAEKDTLFQRITDIDTKIREANAKINAERAGLSEVVCTQTTRRGRNYIAESASGYRGPYRSRIEIVFQVIRESYPNGLSSKEIREKTYNEFGVLVKMQTVAHCLNRLKGKGLISNRKFIWTLVSPGADN